MRIRIATYNTHCCVGRDGVENAERIAAVLAELHADIIALQEIASHSETGGSDVPAYLGAAVAMEPIEGYTLTAPGAHYGNALLTRLPVSAVKHIGISIKGREPRGVIEATFTLRGRTAVLWATHLGLGTRERHLQISRLLKIIDTADGDIKILLGDFNEWLPWSRPLRALHQCFKTPRSMGPSPTTFPSWMPMLRLDRIWVQPAESVASIQVHATELSRIASDHLPLVADLVF